jgi:hypothetical protein
MRNDVNFSASVFSGTIREFIGQLLPTVEDTSYWINLRLDKIAVWETVSHAVEVGYAA